MHFQIYPVIAIPLVAIALPLLTTSADGHELWIDPTNFTVSAGQDVTANLRVGEKFSGGASPYIPTRIERLELHTASGAATISGRAGDRPAIDFKAQEEGLAIVAYESDISTVRYRDFEKFIAFVEHKKFDGALKAHEERNLSKDDFVETYSRHAKSLIGIGSGRGNDVYVGMITEITALDNPYTADISQGMRVRVTYQDAPRTNVQVEIYSRPSGEGNASENVTVETVQTDDEGIATILVERGRDYMLDAVVLREPPSERAAIREAVWDSLWANLTFSVPAATSQ
ncbi:MAG: DUF4198 domain-containing protein [Pseudomonadota bacterium]